MIEFDPQGMVDEWPLAVGLSTVTPEKIAWIWPGRLAQGKITVLDGDPGLGKSTLTIDIAARISTGKSWPDEDVREDREPASVVIVTVEDGIADTILPRCLAAGADPGQISVLQSVEEFDEQKDQTVERIPTLPDGIEYFRTAVIQQQARLLIVDPFFAHLDAGVQAYADHGIRTALAPLARMAEETGCAVLIVRHLNKKSGSSAIYRGGGSIGVIGAARLGMLLGRDPEVDGGLVLAPTKSNLAKMPASLSCRVVPSESNEDVGVVSWEGVSQHAASDVLGADSRPATPAQDEAEVWLNEVLGNGEPKPARDLWEIAQAKGLSKVTVKRAKKRCGVISERVGKAPGGGAWYWRLPKGSTDLDQGDQAA